jgi:hypothetical protein
MDNRALKPVLHYRTTLFFFVSTIVVNDILSKCIPWSREEAMLLDRFFEEINGLMKRSCSSIQYDVIKNTTLSGKTTFRLL